MLNTLKSIGSLSKRKRAEKPVVVAQEEPDQELVIQTKEQSLSGKTSDLGYGGTALGGCGAAWTRSFKMENVSAKNTVKIAAATVVSKAAVMASMKKASEASLTLDECLFEPDGGLCGVAAEDPEGEKLAEDDLADAIEGVFGENSEDEASEEAEETVGEIIKENKGTTTPKKTSVVPSIVVENPDMVEIYRDATEEGEYAETQDAVTPAKMTPVPPPPAEESP